MTAVLRRCSIVLATFLVLGGALGCGSDGGDSGRPTSGETGDQAQATAPDRSPIQTNPRHQPDRNFIRQANAICRRLIPRAEQIRSRYLFESEVDLQQQGFSALAREVSRALGQIAALRQPLRSRQAVRRIYVAAETGITELERAVRDPKAARRILSGVDPFAKTALIARGLGLTSCQATGGIAPPNRPK